MEEERQGCQTTESTESTETTERSGQETPQETPRETPHEMEKEEKAFSQSDVNRIVNKRLAEERNKAETLFAQRERELAQKELRMEACDMLRRRKLPEALATLLDYEDRERCAASIAALEADFQAAVREGIHQALRGLEPPKDGAGRRGAGASVRGAMGLR